MYYGEIKKTDIANGIGVRVSLFVSGCTRHCKNCFNPQTWAFDYGRPFTEETEEELLQALTPAYISGLTVLGGEPFEPANQKALLPFLRRVRGRFPQKSIWCYTGYLFEDLAAGKVGDYGRALLEQLDVLVDGPFVEGLKDIRLRFRGSSNQRLIDVPKSLKENKIVLWEDWQGDLKWMK